MDSWAPFLVSTVNIVASSFEDLENECMLSYTLLSLSLPLREHDGRLFKEPFVLVTRSNSFAQKLLFMNVYTPV